LREGNRFRLQIDPIDLDATLGCGQTFRWTRGDDGSWSGVVGNDICRLTETSDGVLLESLLGGVRARDAV
jgi:hypothetical protein